jgi:VIT1/CCC1 family predicted Fe2+/Mn2+ transporter
LERVSEPPERPKLGRNDYLGAVGVFLLVFIATFPVVIPFMVIRDAVFALRVSNAVALVMLYLAGYSFGRYAHYRPHGMGLLMTFIGTALVALTIALGG